MGEEKKEQRNGQVNFLLGFINKLPSWMPLWLKVVVVITACIILISVALISALPPVSNAAAALWKFYQQQFHPTPTPAPTPIACSVSGHVYDSHDNSRAMQGAIVGY